MTDNECGQGMDSVLDDLLFLWGLLVWTMSFDAHLTHSKVMLCCLDKDLYRVCDGGGSFAWDLNGVRFG